MCLCFVLRSVLCLYRDEMCLCLCEGDCVCESELCVFVNGSVFVRGSCTCVGELCLFLYEGDCVYVCERDLCLCG